MTKQIGDYQLIAELKRGRHATVYRAYEEKQSRFVLLKVLQATDSGTRVRFEKEAAYLAKLQHANVVRVLQYGDTQLPSGKSCSFLALEFIEGQTLAEVMSGRKVPPDLAIYIARESLLALSVAHRHNLVHRDIKPQNILIDSEGHVKVTDFGLAAAIGSYDEKGEIVGTPQYMSPEQARGESVTPASDLFSLGVLMYEMLTAISPFDAETMIERIYRVTHETPAQLSNLLEPKLARLSGLVHRLLEKKPEQRCASTHAVLSELAVCEEELKQRAEAADLCRFLAAPENYQPQTLEPLRLQSARTSRQHWRYVVPAVLLLTALAGAWQFTRQRPQNSQSTPSRITANETILTAADLQQTSAPAANVKQDSGSHLERMPQISSLPNAESTSNTRIASPPVNMVAESEKKAPLEFQAEEAATQPSMGYLRLACLPMAYAVLEGDTLSQIDIEPILLALPAGKNVLTLLNPRFPPVLQAMQVTAGDTLDWKISLWENVAALKLNVRPWAEVFIGGRSYGKTPLGEIMLAPGTYTLTFVHPEREKFVTTRAFVAGQRDTLNIELRPR